MQGYSHYTKTQLKNILKYIDLVEAEDVLLLKGLIKKLNPEAKIVLSSFGKVDLHTIINTKLFDYEKAEIEKFKSSGRVMSIEKYAFKPEIIKDNHIFKIVEFPKSEVFVSDEFKQKVEEAGLKGFKFELVWDSEE